MFQFFHEEVVFDMTRPKIETRNVVGKSDFDL